MTPEANLIKKDRMRFTKDKTASMLALLAIVFDALYFVSIYETDVGNYYYNWGIGASVIYNLLFMLFVFLASESMKSRKPGYSLPLLLVGAMQIVRIFHIPMKALNSTITIGDVELPAMERGQFIYVTVLLVASAVCLIAAAIVSYVNIKTLDAYVRSMEKQSA